MQLRKPVSTLSIPGAMKEGEGEAGLALVGVHSDYPRYTEERSLGGGLIKMQGSLGSAGESTATIATVVK